MKKVNTISKEQDLLMDSRDIYDAPQIDINTFYEGTEANDTVTGYNRFRPTLKTLKTSEMINQRLPRSRGVEYPAPRQNKIVYVSNLGNYRGSHQVPKTFGATNGFGIKESLQKELFRTTGFRKRMKQRDTADIAATINLFRSNVQKFEPRSTIATKKPLAVENKQNIIIPVEDTLFTNRDDAFLTAVNIQEPYEEEKSALEMQAREQISESNIIPGAIDDKDKDQSIQEVLSPSHNLDRPRKSFLPACARNKLPLQHVRSQEKMYQKSSEENYQMLIRRKPKMYISAKDNSVKVQGKPQDKKEHMFRVLHKEGTPTVIYPMSTQFKAKRTGQQTAYEAYLADFNPKALSILDKNAFDKFYNMANDPSSSLEQDKD